MFDNIFEFPYIALRFLGFWGFEHQSRRIKFLYFLYQLAAYVYLTAFLSFLIWDLGKVWTDVHRASTNLSATMTTVMLVWKNIQGLKKMSEARQLKRDLKNGLHTLRDEEDRKILQKAANEMKVTVLTLYALGVTTMTAWLLSGTLLKPREDDDNLPLPLWIPWEHKKTPYYEFALLFQGWGGYCIAIDTISITLYIFGTVIQICAEYDILLKNTQKINFWCETLFKGEKREEYRVLTKEENSIVEEMIVRNIQHHQKIIGCAKKAEDCYVHMMLVQFGGSAVLTTVLCLDLILVSREINFRMYPLVVFLMLIVTDTYLFCSFGSRLINKSHEYLNCIYGISWERMSEKNKKLVSLIVLKSQRPPKLTVEKFANIDLYTLLKLSKIVYNVLYLLLHLAKKG